MGIQRERHGRPDRQPDPTEIGRSEEYEDGLDLTAFLPQWLLDSPWWAISAVLHLTALLLIGGLVLSQSQDEERPTSPTILTRHYKPEDYDPTKPRDVKRTMGIISKPVKDPVHRIKPDKITPDIPKGVDRESLSNKNLRRKHMLDVIGSGPGGSGAYGLPWRIDSHIRLGGTAPTESAVRAALEWLRRHQNPDGSWSCRDYSKRCDTECPCRNHEGNKSPWGDEIGRGWREHDIGVTGLAVLAFTGYGHSHQRGTHPEFVAVLARAARFLKSVQIRGTGDPRYDGCFRFKDSIPTDKTKETTLDEEQGWAYGHAIATMAVGELLALSGDNLGLQRCLEAAARFCLNAQTDGSGWRYSVKSLVPDTSVTGWMVLALKTVRTCNLMGLVTKPAEAELQAAFRGAMAWLDSATSHHTGITGYRAPGDPGSMLRELETAGNGVYPYSKELSCMTGVSVLCRLLAGEKRTSDTIQRGVAVLMRHPPRWRPQSGKARSTVNMYYWYYASLAMHQYGRDHWKEWNKHMMRALLDTQRKLGDRKKAGCADGSWDPIGEWGMAGGRVYATAIGALTLEVYYRYIRIEEGNAL